MNNKLKVAIIDSAELVTKLKEFYLELLKPLGYKIEFLQFTEQNELIDCLSESLVHIVICDLSLGDTDLMNGLNLVQAIKLEWPQILCIGNTRRKVYYRQTAAKIPTFDVFVDKIKLFSSDPIYYENILKEIYTKLNTNVFININSRSNLGYLTPTIHDINLHHIIGQISFTGHPNDSMVKIDDMTLNPLSGGRSGSDVYRLEAYSSESKFNVVPAVLKISTIEKAKIELENYHRYVKWTLPYTWRVDLLGTGFTKTLGGICYSFILSGSSDFDSLTHYIKEKNDDVIDTVISHVFSAQMKTWYNSLKVEMNINKRYSQRYFWNSMDKERRVFEKIVQKHFGAIIENNYIKIEKAIFPHPVDRLFGLPHGDYCTCICHGDLNSNNIIVADNEQFIFIDFQDTGRGHVFEDFVTLEASIRMNYPNDKKVTAHEILKDEINVANYSASNLSLDRPVSKHLKKIKQLAHRNFTDENPLNYSFAAAAFNFRLLRIDELTEQQKILIVAAVLANLKQLVS